MKLVDPQHCTVCGAKTHHSEFCCDTCESQYHEIMEAMGELEVDPGVYIEQYAEEHRPTAIETLVRLGVML